LITIRAEWLLSVAYLVWVQVGQSSGAVSIGWDWSIVEVVLEWTLLAGESGQVGLDVNTLSILSGGESEGSLDSILLGENGLVGGIGWVVGDFWGISKLASCLFWGLSEDDWESNEGEGEELHCDCDCSLWIEKEGVVWRMQTSVV
jgi:hypothetical protein